MSPQHTGRSTIGVDANVAGVLCYALGMVSGFVIVLLERESTFVRFHAIQSMLTFIGFFVLQVVANLVPVFGWLISLPLYLASVAVWIFMMLKAYQGEWYKLPIVGDIAEERAGFDNA